MASGGRRAARAEEMRALLARWERSGAPLSRFAEREGIGRKTLYRWRQRIGVGASDLRRARRSTRTGSRGRGEPAGFMEVSVARRRPAVAVMFEVVVGAGTTVRVPEHFDAGALRRLLETLREC
ncbi:MAG: IS66 family insertion sequence element accessory protein TnpA [Solirubrobacteraceae bacterium]